MKSVVVLSLCSVATLLAIQTVNAQTIALWTFETTANTNGLVFGPGAGNPPGSILADNGLAGGFATGLHATAATYSTPAGDLDPTIAGLAAGPSGPGLPGSGAANATPSLHSFSANNWSVGDYWSFSTSTLGFTGVSVAWNQTSSSTGPVNFGLSYSINGGAFNQIATFSVSTNGWNTTAALPTSLSFSGGGAFDNASQIVFKLIDLNTLTYNGGTVGTGGTDRVDNFTVVSIVPEPTSLALAGLGGLSALLALRRKR